MNLLPMVFASGWASGINAYATVLVLGLVGRLTHSGSVPAGFERTDVLVVMGVLALLELLADKVPYVDSAWDTISTFIRPVMGTVVGALIGGAHGSLASITLASVGGVSALLSHLAKTGIRMAINTSPEPASNLANSVGNDVGVATIASLAVLHPLAAAICAGVLLVVGLALFALLFHRARRGWRSVRRRWSRTGTSGPMAPVA